MTDCNEIDGLAVIMFYNKTAFHSVVPRTAAGTGRWTPWHHGRPQDFFFQGRANGEPRPEGPRRVGAQPGPERSPGTNRFLYNF